MRLLPILALLGCNTTGTTSIGDAPDTETNTDTNDTNDTDDTEGTEPTPYPLSWIGTREIVFEVGCEGTIFENGEEVTKDPDYNELVEACPTCAHIFAADTDPESICNGAVGVSPTIYRGIILNETDVTVVLFGNGDNGWTVSIEAEGELDEKMLAYYYDAEYYSGGDYYYYEAFGEIQIFE